MEGQVLGNRYELIEKIGGGGMSLVYKARCRLLNRFVAVKIMRPEFINDQEFVKRFRIEAQSAASLSHPNIVPIYDVGNDGNIHYIVMEYVDGITLKDYISQKGSLPWREAVNIAIQICSAIKHAHKSHIVHRDIKPHNILLTKEGIAKVTDFGIARAVSSSTITMVGSTIGSVHYFSPEQARGGYTDEKSDLYSLGIALYEMITGRVPFDGDTPVAVALKHIQVEPEEPIKINGSIPFGVNDIILKAIKKDQSSRYQTASELLQDLYTVLDESNRRFLNEENMEDSPTRRVRIVSDDNFLDGGESLAKEDTGKKKNKKKDRATYWIAGIISLVIICVFTYIGYRFVAPSILEQDKQFIVGNYEGKSISVVQPELVEAGIKFTLKEQYSEEYQKGIIISQSIDPGKSLKKDGITPLVLTVSKGQQLIKIPNLRNKDSRDAEETITNLGLVPEIIEEFNETVPIGRVIKTDPGAEDEVKLETSVIIYVSKGPEIKTTRVPDLIGRTFEDAKKLLNDANLTLGKILPEDSSNYIDKIITQEPLPGTEVDEGSAVNITFDVNKSKIAVRSTTITLSDADRYGDTIKVYIEAIPSDTNKVQTIMDETRNKTDFPLTFEFRVPEGGKTSVRIYLDDALYYEFEYPWE